MAPLLLRELSRRQEMEAWTEGSCAIVRPYDDPAWSMSCSYEFTKWHNHGSNVEHDRTRPTADYSVGTATKEFERVSESDHLAYD